jgi:hypothetical protein
MGLMFTGIEGGFSSTITETLLLEFLDGGFGSIDVIYTTGAEFWF